MTFLKQLNRILEELLDSTALQIDKELLIPCLDLTLLKENSSKESISQMAQLAQKHQVAALCVYPHDLLYIPPSFSVRRASVINFPKGLDSVISCKQQITIAKKNGAQEIDYVFPYVMYLEGNHSSALTHACDVIAFCKANQLGIKVILETGAFSDLELLYQLARELIAMKINFLKTSTGKTETGATLSHALTLLCAIKESGSPCGLKVSGGITTCSQAQYYAFLAQLVLQKELSYSWFRIGASSLLQELLNEPALTKPKQSY